jgi:hypothetical protein
MEQTVDGFTHIRLLKSSNAIIVYIVITKMK